jgi:hypothetical protein
MSDEVTPSNKLAALAVDRLIQSGLLRASKRDALIKSEDWKIEIDLATSKAAS